MKNLEAKKPLVKLSTAMVTQPRGGLAVRTGVQAGRDRELVPGKLEMPNLR